jgi:hypothetical protein
VLNTGSKLELWTQAPPFRKSPGTRMTWVETSSAPVFPKLCGWMSIHVFLWTNMIIIPYKYCRDLDI